MRRVPPPSFWETFTDWALALVIVAVALHAAFFWPL